MISYDVIRQRALEAVRMGIASMSTRKVAMWEVCIRQYDTMQCELMRYRALEGEKSTLLPLRLGLEKSYIFFNKHMR